MNHGTTLETTTKNMKQYYFNNITLVIFSFALSLLVGTSAAQCSKDGPLCPDGMCCSIHGWCGYSEDYCGPGNCQSQCPSPPPPSPPPPPYAPPPPISPEDVSNIITEEIFEEMLTYRNDPRCKSNFFYTYEAFLTAARRFPAFGTTGSLENRTRELASFFAQTAHETNGGWPTAEGGPYAWGYCYIREKDPEGDYCSPNVEWPCVPGQQYYGRGPIQLSHNYNYGPAGEYFGLDLLTSPDLVATDSVLSFETAIWFWMTPQGNKPSCHDVAIGAWTPTPADLAANRLPGYGVITNIINGGKECGKGYVVPQEENRIGYYNRFCQILGVNLGDNIDCSNQKNFGDGLMNPRYGVIRMPVY